MNVLDDLLTKCGFVKRSDIEHHLGSIESLVGYELPADYKYYLANFETFDNNIGPQYLVLYGVSELAELNKAINDYDSGTIAIGGNGASETIGLRRISENQYIAVTAQYISDIDDHIEIGSSFTDMIERLHNGKEWFV